MFSLFLLLALVLGACLWFAPAIVSCVRRNVWLATDVCPAGYVPRHVAIHGPSVAISSWIADAGPRSWLDVTDGHQARRDRAKKREIGRQKIRENEIFSAHRKPHQTGWSMTKLITVDYYFRGLSCRHGWALAWPS